MKNRERDSRYEILRLLAMFGIVVDHYLCFGGVQYYGSKYNVLLAGLIAILGGKTCNLVFIMISSWFCVEREELKPISKGTFELFVRCMFFSVFGYIISCFLWEEAFSLNTFVNSFLWMRVNYGFMTNYILLMVIAPVLNMFIKKITEKSLGYFVASILIFTIILNPIYNLPYVVINIEIYLLIGYIKLYCIDKIQGRKVLNVLLVSVLLIALIQVVAFSIGKEYLMFLFDSEFDVAVIVNSLCIFLLASKLPSMRNRIINFLSRGLVSVYLLHENIWIRDNLWESMNCNSYYDSPAMIVHCLLCCSLVFIMGIIGGIAYNIVEDYVVKKILLGFKHRYPNNEFNATIYY